MYTPANNVRRAGRLVSGNLYTLTDSYIVVTTPAGETLYRATYAELRSIRHYGERVTLEHDQRGRIDLQATSEAEARAIANTIRANRIGRRSMTKVAVLLAGIGAVGLLFLCVALLVLVAVFSDPEDNPSRPDRVAPRESGVRVTYRITTSDPSSGISLTMENASGNLEQLDTRTQRGEWERTFQAEPGAFLYVSAQSTEDASVTIGCEILLDGAVIEQATSNGRFVIAECSGSAPD